MRLHLQRTLRRPPSVLVAVIGGCTRAGGRRLVGSNLQCIRSSSVAAPVLQLHSSVDSSAAPQRAADNAGPLQAALRSVLNFSRTYTAAYNPTTDYCTAHCTTSSSATSNYILRRNPTISSTLFANLHNRAAVVHCTDNVHAGDTTGTDNNSTAGKKSTGKAGGHKNKYKSYLLNLVFASGCCAAGGSLISYYRELGYTSNDVLTLVNESVDILDQQAERTLERAVIAAQSLYKRFSRRASLDPHAALLLPDAADLDYPAGLPTLVIDFNKVIAKMEHDKHFGWRVVKRPGAARFFKELMMHYEIVVWSDDSFPVAQEACSKWGLPIIGVLHRDNCTRTQGRYVKDISRLGRNLERVVILDHDEVAFATHPQNGILVKPFEGDPLDNELSHLVGFLKAVAVGGGSVPDAIERYGGGDWDIGRRFEDATRPKKQREVFNRSLGRMLGVDGTVAKTFLSKEAPPKKRLGSVDGL